MATVGTNESATAHGAQKRSRSPGDDDEEQDRVPAPPHDPHQAHDNSSVPTPKRLACMICRKRKLKCDGVRPKCSTCARLGHACAYDEQRRKSGPKRGYVKSLEERLKQLENLVQGQDTPQSNSSARNNHSPNNHSNSLDGQMPSVENPPTQNPPMGGAAQSQLNTAMGLAAGDPDWQLNEDSPQQNVMDDFNFNSMGMGVNAAGGDFTWEMIGLGLEEPLPLQDTIDELHKIYFDKVHPSIPMIHKYRYIAAMNLAPNQRPPICLRYAMWTLACTISVKFDKLKDLFYQRARKYIEADYIKGCGEHMISVAHCQTHILLSAYEMKAMYFPRAWVNTGSAIRLAQMTSMHRLDGSGLDVKQCLSPPKDWTEREERRRTFWMAFCQDRYASIGTGWPMVVDERDILTNLPSSEEAYEMSRPEQTTTLNRATSPAGAGKLSAFGSIVLMASLFGRNLIHLHRPDPDDQDSNLEGPFWKRHRQMDNILLNTSLCLPDHLKLPQGLTSPNIVFANMSIHTSTICLHQAAIFKADANKMAESVSAESKVRCISAASEIASIMKMISHMDLTGANPFLSFCLYVAARVFVQYLKSRPDDSQTADSLRFLLSAMNALKRRNPLTESFLVQLDVDLEALVLRIPKLKNSFPRSSNLPEFMQNFKKKTFCDKPEGIKGIMVYRNECYFMKTVGDDGNVATAPDIVKPKPNSQSMGAAVSSSNPNEQGWLLGEQHQMLIHTPDSEGSHNRTGSVTYPTSGFGNTSTDSQGALGSPDGDPSNRPTPNSSSGCSDQRPHVMPRHINASGSTSFQASPVSPNQTMMNPGALDGNTQGFFSDMSGFTGVMEHQENFVLPNGWGEMQVQTEEAPVGEGVLRALMNMNPMDAMDLSSWDAGNGNSAL